MRVDPKRGGAIPVLSGEEMIASVPGLNDIADFEIINFASVMTWPIQSLYLLFCR
jgi:hypothetical protein